MLNGCNSRKTNFVCANVQVFLSANGRLASGCKGKEYFDETSFRFGRQSDQGSYERSGNCDGDEVDGKRGVNAATGCRRRGRLCCLVYRRRSTTLCPPASIVKARFPV